MKKRADGAPVGATAASLIGIIALLLVFYIIFLPPGERAALFADENLSETGEVIEKKVLLQAPIGKIEFVAENEFDHYLPNLYLHESRGAEILTTINPFTIKKTIYKTDRKAHTFGIADPANTQNVYVSFAAPVHEGALKVRFNDMDVFEGEIRQTNPPPIPISKNYLQKKNTISFQAEGFGIPTRKYELTDVKIIGDVLDKSKLSGMIDLPISQVEHNNLERAWMDFYPLCDQLSVGTMTISINDKSIFSGVPNCESLNRKDIYKEDLKAGKNMVEIMLSSGSASVEQIRLKTILDPTKGFMDYFNVNSVLYEQIADGIQDAELVIKFIDDNKLKNARLNVNGRLYMIDQRTPTYRADISNIIEEGNNYVELTPLTELNIVKLEISAK
ncbi:hypothetical protein KY346_02890 [Candidatus Woesearchaeota archaeon]|nr:hypothetical protein [Candidatus Woesearchaeota archaeon]